MLYNEWEALEQACLSCQKCALADTRHNVVFGMGPRDAEVMCIGEGPGENEDLQGKPFVGRGGKLLDDMLEMVDLSREKNVYIANMVKCRPPQNRDPLNTDFKITKEHGQWFEKNGVWMTALFHPAAILRDPRRRPEAFEDLKIIQAKILEVCDHTY